MWDFRQAFEPLHVRARMHVHVSAEVVSMVMMVLLKWCVTVFSPRKAHMMVVRLQLVRTSVQMMDRRDRPA